MFTSAAARYEADVLVLTVTYYYDVNTLYTAWRGLDSFPLNSFPSSLSVNYAANNPSTRLVELVQYGWILVIVCV